MRRFFQCLLYPIATKVKCILWAYRLLCILPHFVSCNSSAVKKMVVSPIATTWFLCIQYSEKWSCTPILGTKPDFTSAEAKTCSTVLCRESHSHLTPEKRCSTQELLLLKEYKHSEDQWTIKLHTETKPILAWNLLFLYQRAIQLPYQSSCECHLQKITCNFFSVLCGWKIGDLSFFSLQPPQNPTNLQTPLSIQLLPQVTTCPSDSVKNKAFTASFQMTQ